MSVCPKCKARPRRTKDQGYCAECHKIVQRDHRRKLKQRWTDARHAMLHAADMLERNAADPLLWGSARQADLMNVAGQLRKLAGLSRWETVP